MTATTLDAAAARLGTTPDRLRRRLAREWHPPARRPTSRDDDALPCALAERLERSYVDWCAARRVTPTPLGATTLPPRPLDPLPGPPAPTGRPRTPDEINAAWRAIDAEIGRREEGSS
jgi:hypothetical protein